MLIFFAAWQFYDHIFHTLKLLLGPNVLKLIWYSIGVSDVKVEEEVILQSFFVRYIGECVQIMRKEYYLEVGKNLATFLKMGSIEFQLFGE